MTTRIEDAAVFSSTITCSSSAITAQGRSTILVQDDNKRFPIRLTDFRIWDAVQTPLTGTAGTDDLALVGGTWGTNPMRIQAGDLKAAGATTRYARAEVVVPECYVAAQTLTINLYGYMTTTVADNSCTVDIEAYRRDKSGGISADLCTTLAQSINSLTAAEKTFVITETTFGPGDVLEIRIAIACNDAATATAVTPTLSAVDLVCDIKG